MLGSNAIQRPAKFPKLPSWPRSWNESLESVHGQFGQNVTAAAAVAAAAAAAPAAAAGHGAPPSYSSFEGT